MSDTLTIQPTYLVVPEALEARARAVLAWQPWWRRLSAWLTLGLLAHGCACAPLPQALTPEQSACVATVSAVEDAYLVRCECMQEIPSPECLDAARECKRLVLDYFDTVAEQCASVP